MKKLYTAFAIIALVAFCGLAVIMFVQAAASYSSAITLTPGWNVVSTPRLVESHQFTADETAANFDVYVLNPESVTGWATMAEIGQILDITESRVSQILANLIKRLKSLLGQHKYEWLST